MKDNELTNRLVPSMLGRHVRKVVLYRCKVIVKLPGKGFFLSPETTVNFERY